MTKSRGILPPRKPWTEDDIAIMQRLFSTTPTAQVAKTLQRAQPSVNGMAKKLGLKKTPEYLKVMGGQLDGIRGTSTRFQPGHSSWVTGKKGMHLSPKTEFKPGARPVNWMPLGSTRIDSMGILQRKVKEGNNGARNWEAVHRLVWIEAHGPIPKTHCIAFKAGRFTTVLEQITLDAIELLTRKEVMLRNSIWVKDPELAKLYQLKGQINRQVNRINREQEQHA